MECKTDREYLRQVGFDGWALRTWETGNRCNTGRELLGYELEGPDDWGVVFTGEDYGCAPNRAIDSDDALRHLLGVLTLQVGDVDYQYFQDYNAAQWRFACTVAESLAIWAE